MGAGSRELVCSGNQVQVRSGRQRLLLGLVQLWCSCGAIPGQRKPSGAGSLSVKRNPDRPLQTSVTVSGVEAVEVMSIRVPAWTAVDNPLDLASIPVWRLSIR